MGAERRASLTSGGEAPWQVHRHRGAAARPRSDVDGLPDPVELPESRPHVRDPCAAPHRGRSRRRLEPHAVIDDVETEHGTVALRDDADGAAHRPGRDPVAYRVLYERLQKEGR